MVDPGACWPSGDLLVVGCPMVQEGTAGITLLEALPSAWFFQLRAAISSVCLCGSNYFRVAAFYPERNRPDVGGGDCAGMAQIATLSYGIATNYTKVAPTVDSFSNAYGSMWAATLLMIPVALATPIPAEVPMVPTGLAVLALGIVCSGVAYLIYFRLIADFGGVSALTVAFLIPVFGTFWGAWLLGEPVTWSTLIGGLMVLMGTAMVTGFSPSTLFGRTR